MQRLNWSKLILLNEKNVSSVLGEGDSGIFRISTKGEDGKYSVVFVGESGDMKKRLMQVLSKGEPNQSLKLTVQKMPVYFKYSIVQYEDERKNAVHTMFHHFNPECNDIEPNGTKVTMNYD